MIQLSEKWFLSTGPSDNDFCLIEMREGKNPKTGEPTTSEKKTYHPTLDMVARALARQECLEAVKSCEEIIEVQKRLEEASRVLLGDKKVSDDE